MTTDLRFPIGAFQSTNTLTPDARQNAIRSLAETPARMRAAVQGLSNAQLDTPYRDGGWTVRELVHHVPDSHMNAYIRMKLALTEVAPLIKPYDQALWAKLADSKGPIDSSLDLLEALHDRWLRLITSLTPADFARTFRHPERPDMTPTLDWLLALYAWHGPHHVAHITGLRDRMGW
jgi:hypothetical protein